MYRTIWLAVLAGIFAMMSSGAIAQRHTLFECVLNGDENFVFVDLDGDYVTYHYANRMGVVELSINAHIDQVVYEPFDWNARDITEAVRFANGDTTYTVFNRLVETHVVSDAGNMFSVRATGGIIVGHPNGTETLIPCDQNTIKPEYPIIGFMPLDARKRPDIDAFDRCLLGALGPMTCVSVGIEICEARPDKPAQEFGCLREAYGWWEDRLETSMNRAKEAAKEADLDVDQLVHAQSIWQSSRNADCAFASWIQYNPFHEDAGILACKSDYNAKRIRFLNSYAYGAEFGG